MTQPLRILSCLSTLIVLGLFLTATTASAEALQTGQGADSAASSDVLGSRGKKFQGPRGGSR